VIEMNPGLSRSSALASKRRLSDRRRSLPARVGYTLDEIPNDLTRTTPASFEPTLDYIVVSSRGSPSKKFPPRPIRRRHGR